MGIEKMMTRKDKAMQQAYKLQGRVLQILNDDGDTQFRTITRYFRDLNQVLRVISKLESEGASVHKLTIEPIYLE